MTSLKNERITRYSNKTNEFIGVNEGQDEIKLKDVMENRIYSMIGCLIHVRKANKMSIVFQLINSRNLAVGNKYPMEIHLYSR